MVVLAACAGTQPTSGPPANPNHADSVSTPEGFDRQAATLTLGDGTVCELCLWRAATAAQRGRGLMGVTDLGEADGMVFVYEAPVNNRFWMGDTPLPLSIAWFDAAGAFVSADEMTPCLTGPDASCARYGAAAAYQYALELPAGAIDELGVGAGSVLALGEGSGCD
jgi:hypothetical protein